MNEPSVKKTSIFKTIGYIFLGILIAGLAFAYLFSQYTYSEGNRAGVLVKFSEKGFLFKTYEGELNLGGMGNLPNTAQLNQIWEFSVNDKAVADSLMRMEGKRVSLHYKEKIKNMFWQGETNFFVDGAKTVTP
ncbi:MAG: 6-phosphogluconate dehydrogenase [Bacteroidetes bacterium]|nr:6-phosphogluconate dehydrogenase [Bacteroidota bacterium]